MRKIIIVAPYGYEELQRRTMNREKLLVYLGEEAIDLWKSHEHQVVFCSRENYSHKSQSAFCIQAAEYTFAASAPIVFVIIPYALLREFLQELHRLKEGFPEVRTFVEALNWQKQFKRQRVFALRMRYSRKLASKELEFCLEQYHMPLNDEIGVDEYFEAVYAILLSSDWSLLPDLSPWLLTKIARRAQYDGAYPLYREAERIKNSKG
jgi:hypothetical protein